MRRIMKNKQPGKLAGKLALITGATHGIGAAIAEEYAKEGADLILIGLDALALEKIDDVVKAYGVNATLVPLDLKNYIAIDEMINSIAGRFKKLDILVGNAGVLGHIGPMADGSSADWHETIDVNLNANWHLLKACDPLLKQSPAGRAIFVTSGVTTHIAAYWSAYAVSKTALEMMVKIYAKETENAYPNLKINLVNPGPVRTKLRAQAMPGEDPMSLPVPSQVVSVFVDLASDRCRHHGDLIHAQG
jgi:NAD(P)-dependent dehydrogenase (short-subunit alcohol dehydrogenase family)